MADKQEFPPLAKGDLFSRCGQRHLTLFLLLVKGELKRRCGSLRFFRFRCVLSAVRRLLPLAPQGPAWRITGRKTFRQCLVDQLFFRKFFIHRMISHGFAPSIFECRRTHSLHTPWYPTYGIEPAIPAPGGITCVKPATETMTIKLPSVRFGNGELGVY